MLFGMRHKPHDGAIVRKLHLILAGRLDPLASYIEPVCSGGYGIDNRGCAGHIFTVTLLELFGGSNP
jgi:hypothetical protein